MPRRLDVSVLREFFEYRDGRLYWRKSPSHQARVGNEAGNVTTGGYRETCLRRTRLKVHRVIFALAYGRWPIGDIDHVDGNTANNRVENLREATRTQNLANAKKWTHGKTSDRKGVHFERWSNRWRASIGGKRLGRFDTEEQAARAYDEAATELYGEFAKINKGA